MFKILFLIRTKELITESSLWTGEYPIHAAAKYTVHEKNDGFTFGTRIGRVTGYPLHIKDVTVTQDFVILVSVIVQLDNLGLKTYWLIDFYRTNQQEWS